MKEPFLIREVVETVLRAHPPECVFAPGAVEAIVAEVFRANAWSEAELVEAMEAAVKRQEIYCPHEGIDRRAEFADAKVQD